jgi:RluA family pseudouridine synthase
MKIIEEHVVTGSYAGRKLLDFATTFFELLPSRNACKKAINRGELLINGQPSRQTDLLEAGQNVSLQESDQTPPKVFECPLEVLFEDDFIAVIHKPSGIPVSGNKYKTVMNALPFNLASSTQADALLWPKTVHRLDIPTQGLLIAAKTAQALVRLGKMFEDRKIKKRYCALVTGKMDPAGIINQPVDDLQAETAFRTVRVVPSVKTEHLSLVELFPSTGRRHQLRKHLAGSGHPIVGDKTYTEKEPLLKGKGLFLAAVELEFDHPVLPAKVHVEIGVPDKFESLLRREEARWKKYNG